MTGYSGRLRKADGWSRGKVQHQEAAELVRKHHYSGGCSNTAVLSYGLRDPAGHLVGACMWLPPMPGPVGWAARVYGSARPVELSRMVMVPEVPKNGCSFLLAGCRAELKALGYDLALTRADALEGHHGGVYLAAGWQFAGWSTVVARWTDVEGRVRSRRCTHNISAEEARGRGWTRTTGLPKRRFVLAL